MRLFTTTALTAMIAFTGAAMAESHSQLPLKELPGIADRDHWVPGEVNADGALEAMQAVVGGERGGHGYRRRASIGADTGPATRALARSRATVVAR